MMTIDKTLSTAKKVLGIYKVRDAILLVKYNNEAYAHFRIRSWKLTRTSFCHKETVSNTNRDVVESQITRAGRPVACCLLDYRQRSVAYMMLYPPEEAKASILAFYEEQTGAGRPTGNWALTMPYSNPYSKDQYANATGVGMWCHMLSNVVETENRHTLFVVSQEKEEVFCIHAVIERETLFPFTVLDPCFNWTKWEPQCLWKR